MSNPELLASDQLYRVYGSEFPRAAYVHIPFCRRRCFYCDFPISVIGERAWGDTAPAIVGYVDLLCREIMQTPTPQVPLDTVFFGGGTPSLLAPGQVEQILSTLADQIGINSGAEISLEADPGTFNLAQLQGYRAAGINRISLGVQAFQDHLLQASGRFHRLADIEQAGAWVKQAGFENWSLDLISGLPGQTVTDWVKSLTAAIALAPTHLSAYDLVLEPTTVFGKKWQPGQAPLPDEATTATMYELAHTHLTAAGYEHYEISNYAQAGFRCRHNQVYWRNQGYYGFGLGATSYLGQRRITRPRTRQQYEQWLTHLPGNLTESFPDPLIDRWLETLMLGLRLADGLDLGQLTKTFPQAWVARLCQRVANSPWVILTQHQLRLSIPPGFLWSNQVLHSLWSEFAPEAEIGLSIESKD